MVRYIIKRLLYGILVWLGVVVVIFILFQILPGDPSRLIVGQRADAETIERIKRELGLDQPVYIQFMRYLNDVSPVSVHKKDKIKKYDVLLKLYEGEETLAVIKLPYLGRSYHTRRDVWSIIWDAFPNTAALAFSALLLAIVFGIFFGAIAAIRHGSWIDAFISSLSTLGISTPSFFAGLIIAWLFGFLLAEYTGLPMAGSLFEIDPYKGKVLRLENLILPAFTLGIRPMAMITQMTRSAMLDIMQEQFVITGYAKGLPAWKVTIFYVLRNALNPVVTITSSWLAYLLTGAFFIEYIFSWKGIGLLAVKALQNMDFPVVMGVALFSASLFVIINILTDIAYGLLDPRVSLK
ncbi:MAG: ABC transporter permease [Chlorobi bacterium]|nr:ABC transporter permease [Chlorobiota bacterium]